MTVYKNSITGCVHSIKSRVANTVKTICGNMIVGVAREFIPGGDSTVTCKHCLRIIDNQKTKGIRKWKKGK